MAKLSGIPSLRNLRAGFEQEGSVQRQGLSEFDKRLVLDCVIAEYNRLSTELREDTRTMFIGFSVLSTIVGLTLVYAFLNWDKPIVSSILLSIVLPILLFAAMGQGIVIIFGQNYKSHYIQEVLASKVNELLSLSLQTIPVVGAEKEQGKETGEEKPKQETLSAFSGDWESLKQKAWAWDGWFFSQGFRHKYKGTFALQTIIVVIIFLFALVFPIAVGYFRVFLPDGWQQVHMEALSHPFRLTLLIVPVLVLIAEIIAAFGLFAIDRARWGH